MGLAPEAVHIALLSSPGCRAMNWPNWPPVSAGAVRSAAVMHAVPAHFGLCTVVHQEMMDQYFTPTNSESAIHAVQRAIGQRYSLPAGASGDLASAGAACLTASYQCTPSACEHCIHTHQLQDTLVQQQHRSTPHSMTAGAQILAPESVLH